MYYPRLRDLREDADKTQKEIAAVLGIDQRVYSNYETGKREIPSHMLITLADYYHTSWITSSGGNKLCKSEGVPHGNILCG